MRSAGTPRLRATDLGQPGRGVPGILLLNPVRIDATPTHWDVRFMFGRTTKLRALPNSRLKFARFLAALRDEGRPSFALAETR